MCCAGCASGDVRASPGLASQTSALHSLAPYADAYRPRTEVQRELKLLRENAVDPLTLATHWEMDEANQHGVRVCTSVARIQLRLDDELKQQERVRKTQSIKEARAMKQAEAGGNSGEAAAAALAKEDKEEAAALRQGEEARGVADRKAACAQKKVPTEEKKASKRARKVAAELDSLPLPADLDAPNPKRRSAGCTN